MHRIMQLLHQALQKQDEQAQHHNQESLEQKRERARKYLDQRGITQVKGIYNAERSAN